MLPLTDEITKRKFPRKVKKNKWKKKLSQLESEVPVPPLAPQPLEAEDWENEVEEFSRKIASEKEANAVNQTPYDPEDEMNLVLKELNLKVQGKCSPSSQVSYSPASHHRPPVKWVHHMLPVVEDQFRDAED